VTRRVRAGLAALGVALLAPAAAPGAATPVAPAHGSTVGSSLPKLAWTLPPWEYSEAIVVADAPETLPDGEFPLERLVAIEPLPGDARTWTPPEPLPAGTYWWLVQSAASGGDIAARSAPAAFTIEPELGVESIGIVRDPSSRPTQIAVRWSGNVEAAQLVVRVRVRRDGREWLVLARRARDELVEPGGDAVIWFDWSPRAADLGRRTTIVVHARSAGVSARAARTIASL
jgi:hypothetical protein